MSVGFLSDTVETCTPKDLAYLYTSDSIQPHEKLAEIEVFTNVHQVGGFPRFVGSSSGTVRLDNHRQDLGEHLVAAAALV